ncbi:S-adenosyl-L-methionine-dependent methyltransferase [Mycena floridula]|nr:S-adenosyl-L-methionine-dependent methyltransferase [Mycena floridula]
MNHHHHHHHHGPEVQDPATANKDHFNKTAHEYNDMPGAREAAKGVADAVLQLYPFDKNTTTLMDFACGGGLVSLALAPHAKSIVGVDISQGMLDQYIKTNAAYAESISTVCTNLLENPEDPGELSGKKFDVILCSLAFHHFPSTEDATRILASFLNPGGALIVAEFNKFPVMPGHAGHGHGHGASDADAQGSDAGGTDVKPAFVVSMSPIGPDELGKLFEGAGLTDLSFAPMLDVELFGEPSRILVGKGTKL